LPAVLIWFRVAKYIVGAFKAQTQAEAFCQYQAHGKSLASVGFNFVFATAFEPSSFVTKKPIQKMTVFGFCALNRQALQGGAGTRWFQ
jgi:hypothetical protein